MAIEVHVQGQIEPGRLADFREAVGRYRAYAHEHGYAEPEVLFGLSGKMNTIRLIYTYEDLNGYEDHETRTLTDREYAEVGQQMGFVVGSVRYETTARSDPRCSWPSAGGRPGQRLQHLLRLADAPDARENSPDAKGMVLGRSRRTGVLDEDLLVPTLVGVAGRALHPEVGRDAAEEDGVDPPAPQLQIQVGAVERAPLPLAHDVVTILRAELRHDLIPPQRWALPRRRLINQGAQLITPIWGRADVDQNHEDPSGAASLCERGRLGDDRGGVVGCRGHPDDPLLKVDDDQSGVLRVQLEFPSWHRASCGSASCSLAAPNGSVSCWHQTRERP